MSGPERTPLHLTLLGPPASGKGTQGRRLAKRLGLKYLSTGALLRQHVEAQTEVGLIAEPILARGGYLPDDVMCSMIGDWISNSTDGWLLDGFPRSVPQADFLDKQMAASGQALDGVIALEASFDCLIARILDRVECPHCHWSGHQAETSGNGSCPDCGETVRARSDDSKENFTSRFREFERLTHPLTAHYRQRGLLYSCDATASRDEVTDQLLKKLQPSRSAS